MTSRRNFLKSIGATMAVTSLSTAGFSKGTNRPNVLFIAVDDLRTELGCYGNKRIKSSNIDALAQQGIVFVRAYAQQPICMASRASLLSGYRPDYANIYNCKALDELVPDALTINKHFEQNGYAIWASGKIYHYTVDRKKQWGDNYFNPKGEWEGRGYLAAESKRIVKEYAIEWKKQRGSDSQGRGPAFESPDVPDNAYADGIMTEQAIKKLDEFAKSDQPFFMAVGFHKPHLSFNAPRIYWDLYSDEDIKLADNPFLPQNATQFTPYNFGELRNYYGIPKDDKLLDDQLARKLKHGYYASVSYTEWTRNKTRKILARELYDHSTDPAENENIADYKENRKLVKKLSQFLDGGKGWRKFRP